MADSDTKSSTCSDDEASGGNTHHVIVGGIVIFKYTLNCTYIQTIEQVYPRAYIYALGIP